MNKWFLSCHVSVKLQMQTFSHNIYVNKITDGKNNKSIHNSYYNFKFAIICKARPI